MNKLRELTETEKIELKHIRIKRIIVFMMMALWLPGIFLMSFIKSDKFVLFFGFSYLILLM